MVTPSVRNVFLASTFLLASAAANAASVTLVDTANSQVIGGGYAGFYMLNVDDQNVLAMCDDFFTESYVGEHWTADVYTYADIQGGAGKFGPNVAKYGQAGFLISLAGSADAVHQAAIDAAIWNIMDNGAAPAMSGDVLAYYLSATDGTHDAFDYSGIMQVLTPAPLGASQEFLVSVLQTVPVPAASWLFGSAVSLLAGLRLRPR